MPDALPQHCPTPRELDDLQLLLTGALAPTTQFGEPGSPVTLSLPEELADAEEVELVDPEGLPLARVRRDGSLEALAHPQHGPFRRLHLTPEQVRAAYGGATFVPVSGPLTTDQIDDLAQVDGPVVLLALAGTGTPEALSGVALVRATLAAAERLSHADVVVVPLPSHGDAVADHDLGVRVVGNYAGDDPVHALVSGDTPTYPPEIDLIIDRELPPPEEQGLVVFFTGLSGSGKSTLAQALMDLLLEQGTRTLTSLDGDVVRRNLSKGLTFSREDRETNIRRIGWVAAEVARHGGVAVCSPIAPFDETRRQVREMVEEAGGAFFLVHVATPLEECERRDRKGLYAKARRGDIPEFTGISSPYEEPADPAVRVDTTDRTIEAALDDVLDALRATGHLDLPSRPHGTAESAPRDRRLGPTAPPTRPHGTADSAPRDTPGNPIRVLFVCTANICRSPFMELYARHLVDDGSMEFSSAGTHGFTDHPMDEVMALPLGKWEIDHSTFSSRRLTRQLVEEADLVLTAETTHRSFILDEQPAAFGKVLTLGQAAQAVETAEPTLSGRDLLADISRRRGMADTRHDIPDPYRRGEEASAAAADRVVSLLESILPALAGRRS